MLSRRSVCVCLCVCVCVCAREREKERERERERERKRVRVLVHGSAIHDKGRKHSCIHRALSYHSNKACLSHCRPWLLMYLLAR